MYHLDGRLALDHTSHLNYIGRWHALAPPPCDTTALPAYHLDGLLALEHTSHPTYIEQQHTLALLIYETILALLRNPD